MSDCSNYYYYYGSTALCWALAAFSGSWSYIQSLGLLGRVIIPSQGRYLHTEQQKHRINANNTDIHDLSGIRTHDPSVRASEDSSCLRSRGHCDRPCYLLRISKYTGASTSHNPKGLHGLYRDSFTLPYPFLYLHEIPEQLKLIYEI
jgi:hypothetical protein